MTECALLHRNRNSPSDWIVCDYSKSWDVDFCRREAQRFNEIIPEEEWVVGFREVGNWTVETNPSLMPVVCVNEVSCPCHRIDETLTIVNAAKKALSNCLEWPQIEGVILQIERRLSGNETVDSDGDHQEEKI